MRVHKSWGIQVTENGLARACSCMAAKKLRSTGLRSAGRRNRKRSEDRKIGVLDRNSLLHGCKEEVRASGPGFCSAGIKGTRMTRRVKAQGPRARLVEEVRANHNAAGALTRKDQGHSSCRKCKPTVTGAAGALPVTGGFKIPCNISIFPINIIILRKQTRTPPVKKEAHF